MVALVFFLFAVIARCATLEEYRTALDKLDFNAVKKDILKMLVESNTFWPADFGHYGPMMIRNAWHCAGSYRVFDGLGGCDGGRLRFDPERSWPDNTNLIYAQKLLQPIKDKYGIGLSWGDLIILTGNIAIESMGGPVLGFCAGRIDDVDGSQSVLLGPTPEQNTMFPCAVNGNCSLPLGASTIGLIYVNPEGPMGNPIPEQSAGQIREVFGRMGMDDVETISLIGGGHAFGKAHGACPLGAGSSPKESPSNPWPGLCGSGKGADSFTSGFEGSWTTTPLKWNNSYFRELLNNRWIVEKGPGGRNQWRTDGGTPGIMMLTADIALTRDPSGIYQTLVQRFASDHKFLSDTFAQTWYKLTTRDMGPVTRCAGPWVPPPQPFQNPLPPPPSVLPNFNDVKNSIKSAMRTDSRQLLTPDLYDNSAYYGGVFVHLAWQCASTFRRTDYRGGCNGARIRFEPQASWPANVGMDKALQILTPIKQRYSGLSWADLIVLAGTAALEDAAGIPFSFCGGRTDANDGRGSQFLEPNGNPIATAAQVRRDADMMGLTLSEIVVLMGRLRSPAQVARSGYKGSWTSNPTSLSNEYFRVLLSESWQSYIVSESGNVQYKAAGKELYMLPVDINMAADETFLRIIRLYAADNALFKRDFALAWTKIMNSDRFSGPTGNLCTDVSDTSHSHSLIVNMLTILGPFLIYYFGW